MDWIEGLRNTLVALDTSPLIYLIEEHPLWLPVVRPFFQALDDGHFRAVTSTITLTEVLVHPLRHSQPALADQYRNILLGAANLITIPVTAQIANQAAELRAQYGLKTPDAIQLAAAIQASAGIFVTNDKAISLPGTIRIVTLDKLNTLAG